MGEKETKGDYEMKRYLKLLSVILALVCLCSVLLCSCGSAGKNAAHDSAVEVAADESEFGDGLYNSGAEAPAEMAANAQKPDVARIADASARKLIRDASLNVQAEKFDDFLSSLDKKLAECGGFVQSSEISGSSYYYSGNRCASLVVRVPAEKLDSFLNDVSGFGTVTSKSVSVRDVTSDYIDTESKIKALETEQEALLAVLKKAETVADIIEVQNRLTEVRASLETCKSTIKSYDELIAYSTVNLSVDEVERADSVKEEGFGAEIKRRLGDNLYSIGTNARDFAVWFVSSLPFILIFAVAAVIVIIIAKKVVKKRRAKKNKAAQND